VALAAIYGGRNHRQFILVDLPCPTTVLAVAWQRTCSLMSEGKKILYFVWKGEMKCLV
jgi:hypothetical protein